MQSITQQEITDYVAANIQVFHQIRHLENQCQTRLSESNLLFRDVQLFSGQN